MRKLKQVFQFIIHVNPTKILMSSFFKSSIKAMLKDKELYPLLKLNDVIEWKNISNHLRLEKQSHRKDARGNKSYDPLRMFKAILLGQWHNLSDPELERSLRVRLDFLFFCDFEETEIPDHSTLCRYRQWLIQSKQLDYLLNLINEELASQHLKINHASTAIVDASVIQSAGRPSRKGHDIDKELITKRPPSKDEEARWVKKAGKFTLGYKLHASSDEEGYIQALHITPANAHESQHLVPLLESLDEGVELLADKGYSSQANRNALEQGRLKDGIMKKARRGNPLSKSDRRHNKRIQSKRWVIEQSFGTLKRKFQFHRASYFSQQKVEGQSYLKAMCLNLLKGCNKLCYD
jgi:IS5 family transposase